ncbi:MAG: HDOD domain-containing protein [Gracilibacteraceae bacterium]|jgi:EAL and modified HD-GYP domain-containing signal transduction protein|nr:HDOD domain-containing protein [Gracilibacteraceae bacterium]
MKVHVARQPIFDVKRELRAYELLYRDEGSSAYREGTDGNRATRAVVADAITAFGMNNLTNGKYGFVNFTRPLLMGALPSLLNPNEFVIEILEDVEIDSELLAQIEYLKQQKYILALDDYIGVVQNDEIFDYVSIVKVDFRLADQATRTRIARDLLRREITLLAEKVETEEEFRRAVSDGYTLFQGYYFAKPTVFSKATLDVSSNTFLRVMRELRRPEPDFRELARVIRNDISLSFRFLNQINSAAYYAGYRTTSLEDALVRLGLKEINRWVTLLFIRETVNKEMEELARTALVRGVFAEKLAQKIGSGRVAPEEAFTVGMFSMIDAALDENLPQILQELSMSPEVKEALLGADNPLGRILRFTLLYEAGDWDEALAIFAGEKIKSEEIGDFYVEAISYADSVFV